MAAIKLNEAELDALSGLSHQAFRLYVAAIRPRMDYGTGEVGRRVGISWQALREWIYVEPRPGVRAVTHSESMVRRLVKQLVKHGLLREIGDRFRIAFQCPLADTDLSVPKKADKGSTPPQGGRYAKPDNGFEATQPAGKNAKGDTHPKSGKNQKPPPQPPQPCGSGGPEHHIDSPAPAAQSIDNPSDETPPTAQRHRLSEQRHEQANAVGRSQLAGGRAKRHLSWEPHLAWPVRLTDAERAMIHRCLLLAPENLRDVVMDEWRGRIEAGGLTHPFGWLSWKARQAAADGWVPEYAEEVRKRRERAMQVLAAHEAADDNVRQRVAGMTNGYPGKGVLAQLTKVARVMRGGR